MRVKDLRIYPIKGLGGQRVSSIKICGERKILSDRRFLMLTNEGEVLNAKKSEAVHRLRIDYSQDLEVCKIDGNWFELREGNIELEKCISDALEQNIVLKDQGGSPIPDRPEWPGPNLVSEQSIIEIASWFPGISTEELIRRFRANMVLDEEALPPFWEEIELARGAQLVFPLATLIAFKSCERCPVPARNSFTGETTKGFQKEFVRNRENHNSGLNAFGTKHLYYFSLVSQIGEMKEDPEFRIGDQVRLLDPREY